jgi:hypothetical protein
MKRIPLFALLALLLPAAAHAAAPVNDTFEKARILSATAPVLLNQTGVGSTPNALDPFIGGVKLVRSVWYRFDATISTTYNRLIINDKVGVRAAAFELKDPDGNAGTLKFLTQTNNLTPNDVEQLVFPVIQGKRYYLCVEGNGLFDVTHQSTTQPNDYFQDALALTGNEGTVTGSNVGASNVNDTPTTLPLHVPGSGVWYQWSPTFNGQAVVDTNFSERQPNVVFNTRIAVFTGASLATLVPVASDDDSGFGTNSRVVFTATAGTPYRIWVGGTSSQVGPFYLSYFAEGNPGKFELTHTPGEISENQGTSLFHVCRFRAGNVAANVTVSTTNGTALAGADFTAINSVLNFPNPLIDEASWRQDVSLTVLQDLVIQEPGEFFTLKLTAPSPGSSVGDSSPAGVTILPTSPNTAAGFTDSALRVKESAGYIRIPLSRIASGGQVVMHVSSNPASDTPAQAGQDFQSVDETVAFAAGQNYADLYIYLNDDGLYEGDETIILQISSVTPGLPITASENIYITLEDDDLPSPVAGRVSATIDLGYLAANVDIKITASGAVSGKVVMANGSLPFAGTLVNGRLIARLGPATSPVRTLSIEVLNAATKTYRLILNDGEIGSTTTINEVATNYSPLSPCPVAGSYTFADTNGGGGIPQLFAACIKVTPGGDATMTGKLFDGTSVTASGGVNNYNSAYLGASLYAGKGRIFARADLKATAETLSDGILSLLRPGRANQSVELPSLDINKVSARTTRYITPTAGQRALMVWNPAGVGNADLTGGGFAVLTTKALNISTANKVAVAVPLPENLKLAITPSTGFFSGTVIPTGSNVAKPVYGVLHQGGAANGYGSGFFLNGILPGKIKLRGL